MVYCKTLDNMRSVSLIFLVEELSTGRRSMLPSIPGAFC